MDFFDKGKSLIYLKGIFKTASEGILFVDANGHILRTNPAFDKLLGYQKGKLKGRPFIEIVHKSSRVHRTSSLSKIHHFRRSNKLPLKMELIDKKEIAIPVRLRSVLIKNDKGKVVEAIGIVEDLRKDKREMRGSQATYRDTSERKKLEKNLKVHLADLELRNRERQILLDITQNLYQAKSLEDILNIAIEGIKPLFATLGNIALLSNDKKFVQIVKIYMDSKILTKIERLVRAQLIGFKILLEEGNIYTRHFKENLPIVANLHLDNSGDVIQTDARTIIEDFFEKKSPQRKLISILEKLTGYKSSICIPFVSERGDSFGNITIADNRILTENDFYLLKIYAGIISGAIERKKTENKLKEAREFLENIFNTSADGIMTTDHKGFITMANEAIEKMLGYSQDELIGKHTAELSPKGKNYQERAKKFISKLYEASTVAEFEPIWLGKDGSLVDIEMTIAVLKDKEGTITGAVAGIRDITERKKAEEKYHNLIDSASDAIISTNSEGMIISFNKRAEEIYGYSREEIVGKSILLIFPPSEREQQKKGLEQLKKTKKITIAANPLETINVRKDGQEFLAETTISALEVRGEYIYTAFIRDISERQKAETEIREAKEFLENLFKTSSDAIMVTDPQGNITMANTALEKMLGYSRDELLGKHSSILIIPDKKHRAKMIKKIGLLFKEGALYGDESVWQRKDGQLISTESNLSLLKDEDGQVIGGVSFTRDVTEKKMVEGILLQSEKLKSLGELAGGVAHDFNNILAAILGRVQLLRMIIDTSPQKGERRKSVTALKKGLEIVEKAALDGAETVRRIQEFSRRRDDDKYFMEVDLNTVIDDALEFTKVRWKDEAETKGIIIRIKKELSPISPVAGSATELREVLTNLINNAIDALPQGGRIKISTLMNNNYVLVKIGDTGIGIPNAITDRVFDPFFTTKGPQSTGLGMSVSYGIINRHQGTIKLDSVEGRGTTFTIQLPLSLQTGRKEKVISISRKERKARILVIEDEEDVRQLLKDILTENGHEVGTASNGSSGIELFKKNRFDLVLTDLGMPRMSGWQVAKEIKRINKKTPVALITGWEVKLKQSELKKCGVTFVVNKPFKVDQILRLVQDGLASKRKGN